MTPLAPWQIAAGKAIAAVEDALSDVNMSDADLDEVYEHISALKSLCCKNGDHQIGPDQCGKSNHDFCWFCNLRPSDHPEWGYVWTNSTDRWVKQAPLAERQGTALQMPTSVVQLHGGAPQ